MIRQHNYLLLSFSIHRALTSSASAADDEKTASQKERKKLSPEECLLCLRMAVETLESPDLESALPAFEAAGDSDPTLSRERLFQLVNGWQRALSLAQHVQMEAISRFGLDASAGGLLSYEQQLAKVESKVGQELSELKSRKWQAVLSRVFKVDRKFEIMPLAQVQDITLAVADAVQSREFLAKAKGYLDTLGNAVSEAERRRGVVHLLLAEHFKVLSKYGFTGESGYVRFQATVMCHVTDTMVAENVANSSSSVLKHVGV